MTAVYTIVTANYWAHAKSLAASLTRHNPDTELYICLIGNKLSIPADPSFPYKIIDTESLEIEGFPGMRALYNNFELSCALKPFFAEIIFLNYDVDILLYFDSDIIVFNSFHLVVKHLQKYSIVITPHCVDAADRKDNNQLDLNFLNLGLYNAGFFGLRNSEETFRFLHWWKAKLFTECIKDLAHGKYVDQIWLNLVPVYFDEVFILKDYGYNMAIWNMNERVVSKHENVYVVNNTSPLVFFHYSGYDIEFPGILSKYHPIFSFDERPDILPIFEEYKKALEMHGIHTFSKIFVEDKIIEVPIIVKVSLKRRVFNKISKLLPVHN